MRAHTNLKTQSRTTAKVHITFADYRLRCLCFQIRTGIMRRTPTYLTATRLIMLCLLSVVGESMAAIEEVPSSSLHIPRLSPLLNNVEYEEPSEKRSYAYVSEYKRLPLYNFGIGKRWIDSNEDKVSSRRNKTRMCINSDSHTPSTIPYRL